MDQIEHPDIETWSARRLWFEGVFDIEKRGGAYLMSEHATGLLVDLQACFCAGAFVSCVLLSAAIVDSHLLELEVPRGRDGGMRANFAVSSFSQDLEWLRIRRNSLIHFKQNIEPAISVDAQWFNRQKHKIEAERAISLVADVFYENPWA
ncbi:MAG: hypothetical protein NXI16_03535 [Alphaproteobacteria bacterium]|nr:hypothetical protein [Alphaproteobacteria bacterium]